MRRTRSQLAGATVNTLAVDINGRSPTFDPALPRLSSHQAIAPDYGLADSAVAVPNRNASAPGD